jgi:hypothetical protein
MNLTTTTVPKSIEKKILNAIKLKKQLEQYESEIKTELLEAMKDNNIVSIKNDVFTATIAKRTVFSAPEMSNVPSEYKKSVLDNSKCSQHYGLYGSTPEGVEMNETEYLTWRAK